LKSPLIGVSDLIRSRLGNFGTINLEHKEILYCVSDGG
jgi:hypothetical protein